MFRFSLALFATSLFVGSLAVPSKKRDLTSEITALHQANTADDRYAILGPTGLLFNFLDAPSFGGGGKDGGVVLADDTLWPGVIGTGTSGLMGFMGPCGLIPPHLHPRASEILINIGGPPMMSGVIPEGGAPAVVNITNVGDAIILPQGSVHYVANTGCYPGIFVNGFNAESPGVLFISQAFAAFDEETYSAAFGGIGVNMIDNSQIPNVVAIGRQDCLKKCGIDGKTFNINSVTKAELLKQAYEGYLKELGDKIN
jgi:hypothetical protein